MPLIFLTSPFEQRKIYLYITEGSIEKCWIVYKLLKK